MAVQPKKTKTSAKKKPTTKKSTPKRKSRKSKKKSNTKKNILIVLAVFMMIALVTFGYYLGKGNLKGDEVHDEHTESASTTKQLLEDLVKVKAEKPKIKKPQIEKPKVVSTPTIKQKVKEKPKEPKKIKKQQTVQVKKRLPQKTVLAPPAKKPKLVIIIDDVSKQSQLDAIKATGVKLTPAIFPPSELSMSSNRLAKGLKHSMIHLPMESSSKQFNTQYKTLLTHFSEAQIENRAKELRRLFPDTKYINNHTGSVFTANNKAMKKLYQALRNEGFVFVDSRTIGSSKVKKIARGYGDAYVSRDIFIDNEHTVSYIHKQLQKAVKIAKKKGYAIAIGHPHKITMRAIKSAANILKDVELVYIDDIYKEI